MDFEKLYNTCYLKVYSYMMTLAKNQFLAEEITQEAFYKALSSKNEFRSESSELTWLCSIAKNLFYDELRKNQKLAPDGWDEKSPTRSSLEDALADEEQSYRIHVILHELEEPYKEVFQLRIFGELSFHKIGSLFGKSENWARVTYHRAKLKIQERMENDESM